jgi:transposase-like protein
MAAISVKEAASRANIHPQTLYEWARRGMVRARRLARGAGPWRVAVDADGIPLDGDGVPVKRRKGRARR